MPPSPTSIPTASASVVDVVTAAPTPVPETPIPASTVTASLSAVISPLFVITSSPLPALIPLATAVDFVPPSHTAPAEPATPVPVTDIAAVTPTVDASATMAPLFSTLLPPSPTSIPTASAVDVAVLTAALNPLPDTDTPTEGDTAVALTSMFPSFTITLSTSLASIPRAVAAAVVPPSHTASTEAATPVPDTSTFTVAATAVAPAVMLPLFSKRFVSSPISIPTDSASAFEVLTEAAIPFPTTLTPTDAVTAVALASMSPSFVITLSPPPASIPLATASDSTPPSHTSVAVAATPFPATATVIASAFETALAVIAPVLII